ncbi:hypothetical protein COO60DRAFT_865883 [Scenedesmus sp. NREL 46B-D3]|nr:hypothetical protein COO60DRAFT_865883 [Scenedesmus sp. NREL 46B-D3]
MLLGSSASCFKELVLLHLTLLASSSNAVAFIYSSFTGVVITRLRRRRFLSRGKAGELVSGLRCVQLLQQHFFAVTVVHMLAAALVCCSCMGTWRAALDLCRPVISSVRCTLCSPNCCIAAADVGLVDWPATQQHMLMLTMHWVT